MYAVFLTWGRKIHSTHDLTEAQELATMQKPAKAYVMDLRTVDLIFKNWEGSYGPESRESGFASRLCRSGC